MQTLYDPLKEPERKGQPLRKSQRGRSKPAKQKGQVSAHEPVNWTSEHQAALEQLISEITNPPVMAYPDYVKPFILHTDASERGLGAALFQKQDGQLRVIAYIDPALLRRRNETTVFIPAYLNF